MARRTELRQLHLELVPEDSTALLGPKDCQTWFTVGSEACRFARAKHSPSQRRGNHGKYISSRAFLFFSTLPLFPPSRERRKKAMANSPTSRPQLKLVLIQIGP